MKRTASSLMLAALLALSAAAITAPTTEAAGVSAGVIVYSLHVAPDYSSTHSLYAVGSYGDCSADCGRLLRSVDGGATWQRMSGDGWSGRDVVPVSSADRQDRLVAAGTSSLQVSADGGRSFVSSAGPSGVVEAIPAAAGGGVLVSGSGGPWALVSEPAGAVRKVPGPGTSMGTANGVVAQDARPGATLGGFASGTDPRTGVAVVARCDLQWICGTPVVVESVEETVALHASVHVSTDQTLFAAAVMTGSLFRSGDGGRSFVPVTVVPRMQSDVITEVESMAFTADFDGSVKRGTAYAAVVGVRRGGTGSQVSTVGGVYASEDGGVTWRHFGPPGPLDRGSSAVAVTPDGRVIAAYFDPSHRDAGLLCTTDGRRWEQQCPTYSGTAGAIGSTVGQGGQRAGAQGEPGMGGASSASSGQATGSIGVIPEPDDRRTTGIASTHRRPLGLAALVAAVTLALGALVLWMRWAGRARQTEGGG